MCWIVRELADLLPNITGFGWIDSWVLEKPTTASHSHISWKFAWKVAVTLVSVLKCFPGLPVQISDMLNEPCNRDWTKRLGKSVAAVLSAGAQSGAVGNEDTCTGVAWGQASEERATQKERLQPSDDGSVLLEALTCLPDHVIEAVMRTVISEMGGVSAALHAAPSTLLQERILGASRSSDLSRLSIDINPIVLNAVTSEPVRELWPLCLLPNIKTPELRSLSLRAGPSAGTACRRLPDINDELNLQAFKMTLALCSSQLTALSLTDVHVTASTLDLLASNAGLRTRLESLSLTGELAKTQTLRSLTDLIQSANALRRLEFNDRIAAAAPCLRPLQLRSGVKQVTAPHYMRPEAQQAASAAAFYSMLSAATRLTSLSVHTNCLDMPDEVEMPRLRELCVECTACQRTPDQHSLLLACALVCPLAVNVSLRVHACAHRCCLGYRLSDIGARMAAAEPLMMEAPAEEQPVALQRHSLANFPHATGFALSACPVLAKTAIWEKLGSALYQTPGTPAPL